MSRRSNQKLKLLYLSRILLEKTDERHGMTLTQILKELSQYGIEAGRKSVYDDMEALRVYGYDVRCYRDRYVRYYINDRKFERSEVKILSQIVSNAELIPTQKRKDLIKKLWENEYMRGIPTPSIENERLGDDGYKNIELSCRAMAEGKCLAFKCFDWNAFKQRKLKNSGELIIATPWDIIISNGRYQIVCFDHKNKDIVLFAPEKMISTTVVTEKREGDTAFERFCENKADTVTVVLECDNSIATDVFEKFGAESAVLSNGENTFCVSVKPDSEDDLFAWIFIMAGRVRIQSPSAVAQRYLHILNASFDR